MSYNYLEDSSLSYSMSSYSSYSYNYDYYFSYFSYFYDFLDDTLDILISFYWLLFFEIMLVFLIKLSLFIYKCYDYCYLFVCSDEA